MRRWILYPAALGLLVFALASCSGSNTTADNTATSDSLLSSNPIEPPAGDITPQGQMEQEAPPADTKPAASTPVTSTKPRTTPRTTPPSSTPAPAASGYTVAAGTPINISMNTQISSETANVGDTWTGEIKDNVIVGDHVAFPAGSIVTGRVTEVVPAAKGSLAKLGLSVSSISAHGESIPVNASMEPIEADSPRARNIGAVAGGAAAGALIGKAVGGGGKGAVIGGLIGAAASGAAVAKSKGYQVVLKEGMVLDFKTSTDTKIRS
jgi:hypothetical protein